MSFTSDVKKELTALPSATGTLLALIRMNGALGLTPDGLTLSVTTENAATAKYIYESLQALYQLTADLRVRQKSNLAKNRVYTVFVGVEEAQTLLDELSLSDALLIDDGIPDWVRLDEHMQRDYLRGAFLSAGSLSDPDHSRTYYLEVVSLHEAHARDLSELTASFGLMARVVARKNRWILSLSRSEDIMDFLTLTGAMGSRLKYEDAKIVREMRGLANRQSNFEAANISKTVAAAQDMIVAIDQLMRANQLPASLADIAVLRVQHPEASLEELGQMLQPPLGKSGVAHRLRKILAIAREK